MRSQILAILRESTGYVSGETICKALGVSRSAVWKAVEKLRQEGYVISSAPKRGYRLERASEKLSLLEIRPFLEGCPWKDSILVLDRVDSTNRQAKNLAVQGAPAGTVIIAEHQTQGRGRMGRNFESPEGMGIYLSAILRPACGPHDLMHLTCAVAVAMCDAIEEATGLRPGIKWTNDLVCRRRKVCGVLTEMALEAESGQIQYTVVGIGVNCCQREEDFPPELREKAGSLAMMTAEPVNRNRLAASMVKALARMSEGLFREKEAMLARYRADCVTLRQEIRVVRGEQARYGRAIDVDNNGALTVEYGPGELETVSSGEVSVRGLYDYL